MYFLCAHNDTVSDDDAADVIGDKDEATPLTIGKPSLSLALPPTKKIGDGFVLISSCWHYFSKQVVVRFAVSF